jgi:hypothetical protein
MGSITDRIKHAWNALRNDEVEKQLPESYPVYGGSFGYAAHRTRYMSSSERTIIGSIYNRMGIDVAAIDIRHVRLDENDRYVETINSGLNNCFSVEANIDQGARAFKQDIAQTMFEDGYLALVPIDTTLNPLESGSWDIQTMRVGKIVGWYPRHVRVEVYDDREKVGGTRKELIFPKSVVAVIENPLYSVMNEPNSTLQRLIRKLHLLDAVDEASASGKLDILIQLPYVVKSDAKRDAANQRIKDLEVQLKDSTYGVGYVDATEKITQLNRPAENNLLEQVRYLTEMLYAELGITKEVMDGTADEKTMLNYHNRTIEPILAAITQAIKRSFLTKTARSQLQSVEAFRDPFKLVSMADFAEMTDKLSRNEIVSPNEIRAVIGMRPADDPKANELRNSNMPQNQDPPPTDVMEGEPSK